MLQLVDKISNYYVVPVCFITAMLFFIKYSDESQMADALDEHIRENYYAYATLQTIAYLWVYFLINSLP